MRHPGPGPREAIRPQNVWDALEAVMDSIGVLIGVMCLLLGAAAAALFVWFIRRILVQWRRSGSAQRSWPRIAAVVESVDGRAGSGVETARYRFVVDGVEVTGIDDASVVPEATAGTTIEIAYDPADPRDNTIAAKIPGRRWLWLVMSVIVAVLFGLCASGLLALGVDGLFIH